MSYKHFTLNDRRRLQELLLRKLTLREIASMLRRNVSSVSREIRRNLPKNCNDVRLYNAWNANVLSIMRRREKAWQRERLREDTPEWAYVIENLEKYWSPEQIAERWRREHPEQRPFCFSTIYRAIKAEKLPKIRKEKNLRRRGKPYMPRRSRFNTIQPEHTVRDWPDEIRKRARTGDWEGDTVCGGVGKGLVVTLVDRKSRYLRVILLEKKDAKSTKDAVIEALRGLPIHSITFDNGSEFAEFREIEKALDTTVYFAEPHKPWQRGTNENTNDLLRFFFPKGFDFRTVTQADVDAVVDQINNRPRKTLEWKTPLERFQAETSVALD